DDWARAEAAVRAGFAPGDLVVFAPAWMDPVGREHLGDLLDVHAAARLDAARYGAIWEVSARGATAPEATGLPDLDQTFGALRVRRHPHAAAHVTWDLAARSRLVEVGYAPHECAPLRPPATLDAGTVPLGTHLAVAAGLADFRARRDNRAQGAVPVSNRPPGRGQPPRRHRARLPPPPRRHARPRPPPRRLPQGGGRGEGPAGDPRPLRPPRAPPVRRADLFIAALLFAATV